MARVRPRPRVVAHRVAIAASIRAGVLKRHAARPRVASLLRLEVLQDGKFFGEPLRLTEMRTKVRDQLAVRADLDPHRLEPILPVIVRLAAVLASYGCSSKYDL